MVVLMWFGSLSGRVNQGITILLGAFIIQSLLFPASAATLSFQLSFLALGGILLFSVPVARRMAGLLPGWVSFPLASAVGAQCLTGGLVLVRFQALYPVGIAASLVLTPLITLFMWVGLLCLLLSDMVGVQFYLHRAADMVYHCIVYTASWFARMPEIEPGDPVPLFFYWMIVVLVLVSPLVPGKRSG
jgi:competence protein ComEC